MRGLHCCYAHICNEVSIKAALLLLAVCCVGGLWRHGCAGFIRCTMTFDDAERQGTPRYPTTGYRLWWWQPYQWNELGT